MYAPLQFFAWGFGQYNPLIATLISWTTLFRFAHFGDFAGGSGRSNLSSLLISGSCKEEVAWCALHIGTLRFGNRQGARLPKTLVHPYVPHLNLKMRHNSLHETVSSGHPFIRSTHSPVPPDSPRQPCDIDSRSPYPGHPHQSRG
jgi:hypothetical protein